MKAPAPMTREELLELAALDAFGLLDDYEAALYTRSFHHAPAAVQDEVKELQSAFASDPAFLSDVEPSPELRQRVIGAMSQAVESESGELAPLALIGRPRTRGHRTIARSSNNSSSHFWRAAAFVLAAGNIVFAYFGVQFHKDYVAVTRLVIDQQTEDLIKAEIGGQFYESYAGNPNCKQVVLTTSDRSPTTARLYVKEHRDRSDQLVYSLFVVTQELPRLADYVLEATLDGATVMTLEIVTGTSHVGTARIDKGRLNADVHTRFVEVSWRILDADGKEVLTHRV